MKDARASNSADSGEGVLYLDDLQLKTSPDALHFTYPTKVMIGKINV